MDMKKIAKKGAIAKSICNYLLYVENNPKKALELAAEATHLSEFKDWWWKERLGKCYSIVYIFSAYELVNYY
jgi:tetratricopeptide repeat protein 8